MMRFHLIIISVYPQLLSDFPELEFSNSVKFPSYEDSWLSNKQSSDPNNPIVLRRRQDIQARVLVPLSVLYFCYL